MKMINLVDELMTLAAYVIVYFNVVCIVSLFVYISSSLDVCSSPSRTSTSELYSTALTSPESRAKTLKNADEKTQIAITLSSTPNSSSLSPKKASFSGITKRQSFYELSPDISDKHVQMLEKKYGGKERANRAARIIQQQYRSWAMKKTYARLRTQSEARRTSLKGGRLSKRNSAQSPSSSGSLSPNGNPVSFNMNLSVKDEGEKTLKMPQQIFDQKLRRNSAKEDLKPILTDINIDFDFGHAQNSSETPSCDLSVRRVSEDISSIEINKNLLNDSIGQKMIIDEVFQQILCSRKDSLSKSPRKDNFRSNIGEKMDTLEESGVETESTSNVKEVSDEQRGSNEVDTVDQRGSNEVDTVDQRGSNEVDTVDNAEQSNGSLGGILDNGESAISTQVEHVVMAEDEMPHNQNTAMSTMDACKDETSMSQ